MAAFEEIVGKRGNGRPACVHRLDQLFRLGDLCRRRPCMYGDRANAKEDSVQSLEDTFRAVECPTLVCLFVRIIYGMRAHELRPR